MLNLANVQRIFGMLVALFSLTLIPPIGVALYYQDGALAPFVEFDTRSTDPVKGRIELALKEKIITERRN